MMLDRARGVLQTTFGFENFRPLQEEVIASVLAGQDCVVIMPTGGGKSLCYQIPALIFEGLTLVVSPLISLMQDQVSQLVQLDIAARFLNSSLSAQQYNQILREIQDGLVKILYVAPETLVKSQVIGLLKTIAISCLAIDEAHCISEWGHDFRPEYRQLATLRGNFSGAVVLALTATATPRVREDINGNLALKQAKQFVGSFNRKNLYLQVKAKDEPVAQVLEMLKKYEGKSGIIYCATRRQVDELAGYLASQGVSVAPYHAGLADERRRKNQHDFVRDDLQIMVATVAFGMGIDKPNVRFVIHYDLPKNIEGYYQEIGRAGRDGLDAHCLLLFSYSDIHKINYFIEQKSESEKRLARIHLDAMVGYAESTICRRAPLLRYFGEAFEVEETEQGCGMCDNCMGGGQDLIDLTVPAQKFLSCVKRTGELFGIVHVIDVLLGSKNKKVLQHQHQNLSTYGIGLEYSKRQWSHLARQCLQHGLLTMDEKYGSVQLTVKSWEVLRGEVAFYGVVIAEEKVRPVLEKRVMPGTPDYDANLFAILRKRRKELADRANVPPYAVFPDRTLIELSAKLPREVGQLQGIHGIGKVKLEKYGAIFLEDICHYCEEQSIPAPILPVGAGVGGGNLSTFDRQQGRQPSGRKLRHVEVGELYAAGDSIAVLMSRYGVQANTIISHLERYAGEGGEVRPGGLRELLTLSPEQEQQVAKCFQELGTEALSPVREAVGGEIGYDELKIVRLLYGIGEIG